MTLYTFSGFFTIALITVACLPFIMNPNDFKQEIEEAVQDLTGRTLTIDGDIKLSLFPWLGFSTQKITLGNAKGFQRPYFAQIKQSQLKIRVIPLLSKKLAVSEIIIKGLHLHLAKNTQGQSNWADLEALSTEDDSKTDIPLSILSVAGFLLEDARIIWDDPKNNQNITLSHINLSVGQWGFDQKMPLKLSLNLANKTPQLNQKLNFSSDFFINKRFDSFQLQNTALSLETKSPLVGTKPLMVQFFSHLQFDNPKQLLTFKNLQINSGRLVFKAKGDYNLQQKNLKLSAAIEQLNLIEWSDILGFSIPKQLDKKILTLNLTTDLNFNHSLQILRLNKLTLDNGKVSLRAKGQYNVNPQTIKLALDIANFKAQKVLPLFGVSLPKMTDATVLNNVALKLILEANENRGTIKKLQLKVDEMLVTGALHIKNFSDPTIKVDLLTNNINLDQYLPVEKKPSKTEKISKASNAQTKKLDPITLLRTLKVSGKIVIEQLKTKGVTLKGITLKLDEKKAS